MKCFKYCFAIHASSLLWDFSSAFFRARPFLNTRNKLNKTTFALNAVPNGGETIMKEEEYLANELKYCDGEIIDTHLHIAPWFNTSDELIEELEKNDVSIGILYNPYPKVSLPFDVNTFVHSIASSSNGKIFMLASMNMTHECWEEHREEEMERLRYFLEKKETLGGKIAPPHTCLPIASPMVDDFIDVLAQSSKKLLGIHIGTTPFCGPLGKAYGIECDCSEKCVDPGLLIPKIEQYPDVQFLLLHSGHEFLPESEKDHYGWKFTDKCIQMAKKYPNVYISISALFGQTPEGEMKYPGGDKVVKKMKEAGVCHKVFWGSDASHLKNQIKPVLISAIKAMVDAEWTQEERTWTLRGLARDLFKLPNE